MTIPTILTLDDVQRHLRMPIEADQDLQQKLDAATQTVCEYISDRTPIDLEWITTIEAWNVGNASPRNPAPPVVKLAVMELTADLYRFRGDDQGDDRDREAGFLPLPVRNLLVRYRDPTAA